MKICTLLGADNVRYQADILPSETEILMFFKVMKDKLSGADIKRLSDMIEAYVDDRAEVAVINESID